MRKILLTATMIVAFGAIPARAKTVQELLSVCEYPEITGDDFANGMHFGECTGYIQGVFEMTSVFKVCSHETTHGQTKAVFIAWAHRNPQNWSDHATVGLIKAFQEAWPRANPFASPPPQ